MPTYVDFTTWTQVGNGNLGQTPTRSSWTTWRRDDPTAYLRGDYGEDYFGIAFTHQLILEMTDMDAGDTSDRAYNDIWALTNNSTTTGINPSIRLIARQEANSDTIFRLRLTLDSTAQSRQDSSILLDDTKYYLTIVRNNSGKTITVTIRTGSHAGPVVDTIDCYNLDFTQSLRYIFAPWKQYATSDPSDDSTGYVEYLDIGEVPPDPPTNVSATDGTYSDKVRITWTKSDGATGYQVYRNGTPLGWLGDVALFDDTGADAPTITPGTTDASDGDHTSHVFVYVTGHQTNNGTTHTYKVKARNVEGESGYSGTNTGYRGPGSLSYQWYRSNIDADSGYYLIDGATSSVYSDYAAPAPTITHGSVAASGIYSLHVRLTNSGESANVGDGRYYKCRLQAAGCVTQYSTPDRGYRGVGALTYQWYRSAGDSDASYSSIPGATYEPYNDTGAPAPTITKGSVTATDGDHTDKVRLDASGYGTSNGNGRYYKCYHTATGATPGYTAADRGNRIPGVLTRQWQKSAADSDASYSNITGAVSDPYDYTGAPAPTITPGTAAASDGTYVAYVRLILSGESTTVGAGRYYRAKYTATGCVTQYTSANRGYRGVGSLTYQWRRSAADSDADYSNIDGATTDPYNDTGAPENGDGRWYYCRLNATGAVQQDSTHNRGYRLVVLTMIGGPTGYTWGTLVLDVSIVRITTDDGRTWIWGVATSPITIPDGSPIGWAWAEF